VSDGTAVSQTTFTPSGCSGASVIILVRFAEPIIETLANVM